MTRAEREFLIERYLAGEMDLDQEREFIMQAATDPETFQMLRAYQVVERALRNDRDVMTGGDPEIEHRALTLLEQGEPAVTTPATRAPLFRAGIGWTWAATLLVAVLTGYFGRDLIGGHPNADPAQKPGSTAAQPLPQAASATAVADGPAAIPPAGTPQTETPHSAAPVRRTASHERNTGTPVPAPAGRSTAVEAAPRTLSEETSASATTSRTEREIPRDRDSVAFRARIVLPR